MIIESYWRPKNEKKGLILVLAGGVCAMLGAACCVAAGDRGAPAGFNHRSGFYDAPFELELSTPLAGGVIYYTTNGAEPWPGTAARYERPIVIGCSTALRAKVFGARLPHQPGPDSKSQKRAREHFGAAGGSGLEVEQSGTVRTFLFKADILRQTGAGFPSTWGQTELGPVRPYYVLSEAVSEDPAIRQAFVEGLGALPILSIVTDKEGLFGAVAGIYSNPTQRGGAWERSAVVEFISGDERRGFEVACGLRIHGGMSRRPEESPKHSFRLVFRKRYSGGPLRFPLFGDRGPGEFDSLVLRAGNNNSWLDSSGDGRRRADYLRDSWMRQSMAAMGYPSARDRFVHVFLDGLYWGIYDLCERPGAELMADDEGEAPSDFDLRKGAKIQAGDEAAWDTMMALANGGVDQDSKYAALGRMLDLPEAVDFLILNFYAGNSDWDRSANWYAGRARTGDGRFRFFVWDAERTLESVDANTIDFDDDESPPRLFHKLAENGRFQAFFADKVQRLLVHGPLAPGPAGERFRVLAKGIEKAIACEAARWGSYRKDAHRYRSGPYERYTAAGHWEPEIRRLLTEYFPARTAIVLNQFRERGLFRGQ